ncbi:MAG: GerMN domain-containing protein [Treponema sp.]|nr:GerMN domain-containing protein [Treponema sp.]
MAVNNSRSRSNRKIQSGGPKAIVVFWLVFIIIIITIFMANAEIIKKNFNLFKTRFTSSPGAESFASDTEQDMLAEDGVTETPAPVNPPASQEPAHRTEPAVTQTSGTPASEQPASQTARPESQTQSQSAAQTRDRSVYFTQIDRDGQILQSRVIRRIPVSDSPMQDVLNSLLIGPTAEEINRGIINLIPQNTRILSIPSIRGTTAYINFSEDFLFNTFGIEGYVAQLRQIVWTVTEFSTVNDVQILIDGRRLDYLGEGIWIGSPISRQSF